MRSDKLSIALTIPDAYASAELPKLGSSWRGLTKTEGQVSILLEESVGKHKLKQAFRSRIVCASSFLYHCLCRVSVKVMVD
jgi:hypothetical protein